jgi:hypothetical protein
VKLFLKISVFLKETSPHKARLNVGLVYEALKGLELGSESDRESISFTRSLLGWFHSCLMGRRRFSQQKLDPDPLQT